jgi:hypothetical protein
MLLLVAQPTKQTVLNSGNSLSLPPSSWKSTMLNGLRECEVADAHARGSVDDRTIVTKKGEIGRMNKKDTVRQRSKSGVGRGCKPGELPRVQQSFEESSHRQMAHRVIGRDRLTVWRR